VLFSQFLAQRSAHDDSSDAGRGTEMRLSRLASGRVKAGVDLRHGGGDRVLDVGFRRRFRRRKSFSMLWPKTSLNPWQVLMPYYQGDRTCRDSSVTLNLYFVNESQSFMGAPQRC
jgi:hypothetical protein